MIKCLTCNKTFKEYSIQSVFWSGDKIESCPYCQINIYQGDFEKEENIMKKNNNIEWLETRADNFTDTFKFAVEKEWLQDVLRGYAEQDAEDVTNNKEDYIEGRIEHLYESLDSEIDLCESIYQLASEQKVIVDCKEIKSL